MPESRPLTAIVCDPDPFTRASTSSLAADAGFEVLEAIAYSVDVARQAEILAPSLVVIVHEQSGLPGLAAVAEVRAVRPAPPEVVLLTSDTSIEDRALEAGAFAIALRGDPAMVERVLDEVRELLETGERRSSGDRRSGSDRREAQDWSKVTSERRSGVDRRQGPRREDDRLAKAHEVLDDRPHVSHTTAAT